jgi:hypothetical protein
MNDTPAQPGVLESSTPDLPPSEPEVSREFQEPPSWRRRWAGRAARARHQLGDGWRLSWLCAFMVYVLVTGVYFATAPREVIFEHTPCNHFAHLAQSWLDGRFDLKDGPPAYAQNNDFAQYKGKWYVAFPPFPALILLPFVAFAGEPEGVRDGQVFLWLAGVGPAILFLALERLRRCGRSPRSVGGNLLLALAFAFGTVFYFTAVQGTVWFAAHVVGVALAAGYLFFCLNGTHPFLAGVCLGLASLTRAPLLFAVPLFLFEALRASDRGSPFLQGRGATFSLRWFSAQSARLEWRKLIPMLLWFSIPVAACLAVSFVHNYVRFGSPFETGYQYLTVAWAARMKKWGLFHLHYLPRNLGVLLTQLPWPEAHRWQFRINVHGLALWFTTPLYLWLLWPKRKRSPHLALWLTVAAVAVPTLFYQNTGWSQFGYRFSNDYAVFLFALLAIGVRRIRSWMVLAILFGVAVNTFGAVTFGRSQFGRFYYTDPSQQKFYQPD